MKTFFNFIGNGACPMCKKDRECIIKKLIGETLKEMKDPENHGLEMVVYRCPHFQE